MIGIQIKSRSQDGVIGSLKPSNLPPDPAHDLLDSLAVFPYCAGSDAAGEGTSQAYVCDDDNRRVSVANLMI